jgi:hypothetical protein
MRGWRALQKGEALRSRGGGLGGGCCCCCPLARREREVVCRLGRGESKSVQLAFLPPRRSSQNLDGARARSPSFSAAQPTTTNSINNGSSSLPSAYKSHARAHTQQHPKTISLSSSSLSPSPNKKMARRPSPNNNNNNNTPLLLLLVVLATATITLAAAQPPRPPTPPRPPAPTPVPPPPAAPGANTNLCASVTCANGGKCQGKTGLCRCKPGTSGPLCGSVKPGFWFDRTTTKPCPSNNYCLGTPSTKTACPTHSITQGAKKAALADCRLKPGYTCVYTENGPCVPTLCPPDSYCPGKISVAAEGKPTGKVDCVCSSPATGCASSLAGSTSASACRCVSCADGAACDVDLDCAAPSTCVKETVEALTGVCTAPPPTTTP